MPKKPTTEDLRNLLSPRPEPCISIYLPLPRHGRELGAAPVRFRALVREAEALLAERFDARRVREFLAPLAGLAEAPDVFAPGPDGLAIFRADGLFESYRLRPAPPERAVVADSFHLKPLLRCLQDRHSWTLVALGSRRVALFEGSERGIEPRPSPGLPVPAASGGEVGGRGGSPRGGPRAAGSGKAPGEGDGGRREELLRFFRAVDAALREAVPGDLPVVVAGEASLFPLLREASAKPERYAEWVEGAVDDVGPEELHSRTLPAAQRALSARDAAVVEEFLRQQDRGLAADVLTEVAAAAVNGRVRRLLVADGTPLFGRLDRTTGEVTLHAGQSGPQDDDVLDDLAEVVLARGGEVLVLEPRRMPHEAAAAAILRW